MNPESIVMHKISAALSAEGCFVLRTNSGVFYDSNGNRVRVGFPGLSDLIGFRPDGKFFALEIKTQTGRPTEEQLKFIDFCHRKGIPAGIARSVEDALRILEVGK